MTHSGPSVPNHQHATLPPNSARQPTKARSTRSADRRHPLWSTQLSLNLTRLSSTGPRSELDQPWPWPQYPPPHDQTISRLSQVLTLKSGNWTRLVDWTFLPTALFRSSSCSGPALSAGAETSQNDVGEGTGNQRNSR